MDEYEYISYRRVRVHWLWMSTSTLVMDEYEYIGYGRVRVHW